MATNTALQADQVEARKAKGFARFLPPTARIFMGLPFFIFGLNGFLNFIPQPTTPAPAGALAFQVAMVKTGYLLFIWWRAQRLSAGRCC